MTKRTAHDYFPSVPFLALCVLVLGVTAVPARAQEQPAQEQLASRLLRPQVSTTGAREAFSSIPGKLQQIISVQFEGVTLEEALHRIAEAGGVKLFYPKLAVLSEQEVHLDLGRVTVLAAVRAAIRGTKLRLQLSRSGHLVLFRTAEAKARPVRPEPMGAARSLRKLVPAKLESIRLPAQQTVTGTVTDSASGEVLPGVNVVVKGTSLGTATGAGGSYELTVPSLQDTLVFSFVGYETKTVPIKGRSTVDVQLTQKVIQGEEVVVVGYGTERAKNLTGAISSVSGEVLENRPITSLAEGLQGTIPNLNISFYSGATGDQGASFNIRGYESINGGSPLILVDGVPTTNLSLINPSNIESISVLKDAASAAIYGARAAFGVILINTKEGRRNQPIMVNYSNSFIASTPTRVPDLVNSWEFAQSMNTSRLNTNGTRFLNEEEMKKVHNYYQNPTGSCEDVGPDGYYFYFCNTNWVDVIFQDYSLSQKHNVSVSGGWKNTSFYASLGYLNQNGILEHGNDSYQRFNLRLNLETDVTDWMTARFKVAYIRDHEDEPRTYDYIGTYWHAIYRSYPISPMRHPDGTWAGRFNAIAYIEDGGREKETTTEFRLTLEDEVRLGEHFNLTGNFTFKPYYQSYRSFRRTVPIQYESGPDRFTAFSTPNWVYKSTDNDQYYQVSLHGTYTNTFAERHTVEAMLGASREWKEYEFYSAKGNQLVSNNVPSLNLVTGERFVDASSTSWALQSLFFRVNYRFADRYLFEINGRLDGTSRFPEGRRYGFFPSVSAGWRVSEEPFWPKETLGFIDNLKLRASYGSLGNQQVANFGFIPTLGVDPQVNYILNGSFPVGVYPPGLVSNNRTWETVTTYDVGLDLTALNQRLNLTFDWYTRYTRNMLIDVTYPDVLGTDAPRENGANLRTRGWGLSLSWDDVAGEVQYGFSLSLSDHQAVITNFEGPAGSLSNYYVGQELGEIWGYTTVGLFQSEEEVEQAADQSFLWGGDWGPGDVHYKDINGDRVINNGDYTVENPGDLRVIGNSTPRYQFGIRSHAGWKGFDVSIFFQGVGKRDYMPNGPLFWGFTGPYVVLTEQIYHSSWRPGNRDAYYPILKIDADYNTHTQTRYLQNAAYIRLKNVTIGYTIPQSLASTLQLKSARVYFSGRNLWEYTRLVETFDPEGIYAESWFGSGKIYPFQRSYSVGINLTF